MIEGFFRIAFTGRSGSGLGVLVLDRGAVAGADVSGVMYDGSYNQSSEGGTITFEIAMRAPAGVALVQTGEVLAAPRTLPITGSVEQDEIGSGRPILMQTPLGPVNVAFQKLRELGIPT